ILPGIEIGDKVMPLLALEVLPPWLAGIVLAAPMAAIMSTVDSLLLLVSSSIVKDLYLNYIEPKATHTRVKRFIIGVTAILGIIVFVIALYPAELIIWLNLFACGGLEGVFIWSFIMGIYWKKGNKFGSLSSMIVGVALYVLSDLFYPEPLGMHCVVLPTVLAF